jgi:hypothetical protein
LHQLCATAAAAAPKSQAASCGRGFGFISPRIIQPPALWNAYRPVLYKLQTAFHDLMHSLHVCLSHVSPAGLLHPAFSTVSPTAALITCVWIYSSWLVCYKQARQVTDDGCVIRQLYYDMASTLAADNAWMLSICCARAAAPEYGALQAWQAMCVHMCCGSCAWKICVDSRVVILLERALMVLPYWPQ